MVFCAVVEKENVPVPVYEFTLAWLNCFQMDWKSSISEMAADLPKPIGIMACNDARALHLLDACHQTGMLVPEEVAVIGVDNEEYSANSAIPRCSKRGTRCRTHRLPAAELLDNLCRDKLLLARGFWLILSGCNPPLIGYTRHQRADVAAAVRFISEQALHGCTVAD